MLSALKLLSARRGATAGSLGGGNDMGGHHQGDTADGETGERRGRAPEEPHPRRPAAPQPSHEPTPKRRSARRVSWGGEVGLVRVGL